MLPSLQWLAHGRGPLSCPWKLDFERLIGSQWSKDVKSSSARHEFMSRACSMACLNMSEYVWCLNVQTFSWQQDATSYASYATSFNKICQDLCVVEVTVCCWERSRGRSWMRLWRSRCGRDVLRNMTSRDSKKWSDEIKRFKYILIWFKLRVIWCQDLFFSPSGADLFKSIVFLCQIICVFMGKASQTDKYTDIHCYIIIWYYIYTQLCIFIYIIYI